MADRYKVSTAYASIQINTLAAGAIFYNSEITLDRLVFYRGGCQKSLLPISQTCRLRAIERSAMWTELNALRRSHSRFQDGPHLCLGAAAMMNRTHAQCAIYLIDKTIITLRASGVSRQIEAFRYQPVNLLRITT
jgi:hypothetical protein